ncbi:type II secretion system inner membrane protein GspF [Aquabacterium sp. CECT 9606]|uniref:type II secretion system inner membrane protein GspF n=1 Tax=Aquabacterium sp. CECT 9606 TaxID=2845822 RepID=UPI001E481F07|nr:type II secretion system inner membrane protein GspF [Aquabacterium sp. CECT 9606]CAH0351426.1 Type II secretion system protein F [Aquabacterium sp. CECT 9606]
MPAFRFEALETSGKTVTGLVDSDNPKTARAQLRSQQLVPLKIEPVQVTEEQGQQRSMFTRRAFNSTSLAIWTRQLSGLVSAGLPLERALTALADESEDPQQRELVAHLRSEVNAGSPFARALSGSPKEFDEVYRGVVAAGEQSGQLGTVLEKLADDLEEQGALKSKLIGATLYPAVVSVFAIVVVVALLVFVVPQVAQVFSSSKRALPILTRVMLGLSAFMREWGWLLILLMIGGFTSLVFALRGEAFRRKFDSFTLGVPVIGRLIRGYNAARFAGTLAMLAGSGVPILKALQAAAETLSNRAMRADAMEALVQVREGAPLASALAAKKRFPGLLSMFARLGEQTGQLPVMLQRAAKQLSTEVQRKALAIATVLEPLLIVFMGLMVMLIVMSVMMPIMQMNTWVK